VINEERLVQTFLDLVRIDSPSEHEEEIGRELEARLDSLGLRTDRDVSGNVFGWLDGDAALGGSLLLNAHMDTVGLDSGITPLIDDGVIRSDGTTILGADDKSGVAIILEVLQVLNEQGLNHRPLEILFTVEEELNLGRAGRIDLSKLSAGQGIVLDSGGPIGTYVKSAPSQDKIEVWVKGRAAHAGSSPEKGINAILVASEAIASMPLGRIDEETTSNIGIIRGGTATNIVPDEVYVKGMARSRDENKLVVQVEAMVQAFEEAAARHNATAEINVEHAYYCYHVQDDAPLRSLVENAASRIGLQPLAIGSGGGSDANIFNRTGIESLPLSTGMCDVHTKHEHIAIVDMVDSARLVLEVVRSSA
jgi:tripeptide aminopeptidase